MGEPTRATGGRRRALTALAALGACGLAACSPEPERDPAARDADVDADSGIDEGDDDGDIEIADGDLDGDGQTDPTCDSQRFEIATEPPQVMILLDQSASMIESSWGGHSHWTETQQGLAALLGDARNQDTIFGLDPFPDGARDYLERCHDECCRQPACMMEELERCTALSETCERACAVDLPPEVALAPAPVSAPEILAYVRLAQVPTTFGRTPLVEQIRWYAQDHSDLLPGFYADDGSAYLVVLSDGTDTCEAGVDAPVAEIEAALREATSELVERRGIRIFAIGFGDTTGDMARELDAIAERGGTEFGHFFPITEAGALLDAFDRISTSIVSCTYDIVEPDATADPNAVNFYFDGGVVGLDETCTNGWRWVDEAHLRVEFCGPACERLKGGEVATIEARFGCSTVVW